MLKHALHQCKTKWNSRLQTWSGRQRSLEHRTKVWRWPLISDCYLDGKISIKSAFSYCCINHERPHSLLTLSLPSSSSLSSTSYAFYLFIKRARIILARDDDAIFDDFVFARFSASSFSYYFSSSESELELACTLLSSASTFNVVFEVDTSGASTSCALSYFSSTCSCMTSWTVAGLLIWWYLSCWRISRSSPLLTNGYSYLLGSATEIIVAVDAWLSRRFGNSWALVDWPDTRAIVYLRVGASGAIYSAAKFYEDKAAPFCRRFDCSMTFGTCRSA